MTEEKKTPSYEDIEKSFYEKCSHQSEKLCGETQCRNCDLRTEAAFCDDIIKEVDCKPRYIYEVATGKRPLDKPLWNPPTTPEWFKVGAKLWRKSCNDWVAIKSLTPMREADKDGNAIFNIVMGAWDGSEDEAMLPYTYFSPEAPFSESFRKVLGKHAWHNGLRLVVRIVGYAYETNTVYFSYTDKNGVYTSEQEEFHEENFVADTESPSWLKVGQWIGATKDCRAIGEIVSINGDIIEVDWIVNGKPVGEQFDVTCSTQVLAFVPVKFRPYAFEEAVKLLGKVMEYEVDKKYRYRTMITTVCESGESCDGYCINLLSHNYWVRHNATIDGLPIGVPVVDEELLSKP